MECLVTERVIGVIPARYESSRLPGKPLLEIHGKPMIYWVAMRVAQSTLDDYLVATDDKRIMATCENYNIPCLLTSIDCRNGTERVAETTKKIKADYYINVQGDEPLINVRAINQVRLYMIENKPKGFVQAVSPLDETETEDPSIVKVAVSEDLRIIYLSRCPVPFFQRQGQGHVQYIRCMGLYGYSGDFCRSYSGLTARSLERAEQIEQLRCLEYGLPIEPILVEDEGISVDTCSDLEKIRLRPVEEFQR